jgi:small ligand-binding sensory domain FIST
MKWVSAIADEAGFDAALDHAVAGVRESLGGEQADLVLVFASAEHAAHADLAARIAAAFPGATVAGCSGGGVIGAGREVEHGAGLALAAARMPGVTITGHRFGGGMPKADTVEAWHEELGFDDPSASFVVLADPFGFDAERLLGGLDGAFPDAVKIGGLCSGATIPDGNALFLGGERFTRGALVIALRGDVAVDPILAQGCKPIGEPLIVTSCDGNLVFSLAGKLPGDVVRELHDSLDEEDKKLFRHSLFVGVEMRNQKEYRAGDFLVRNVVGMERDGSKLAVAARLEQWQVVQFHLRDGKASSADLGRQLDRYLEHGHAPAGALLFSCLGRGEQLYGRANHDSDAFQSKLGALPLAGFFCNGEIGPVSGKTFLHGYTSAFGVFRARVA